MSIRLPWIPMLAALLMTAPLTAWGKKKVPPVVPGSATLESKSEPLVLDSPDALLPFARVTEQMPARLVLTGPAKFQVDFRLNLQLDDNVTAILSMFADTKPVQSYRVTGKVPGLSWKGTALRASGSTGFFIDVPEGKQTWEFRLKGASANGGAILVQNSATAKPIAATAPVLRAAPAVAKATAVATSSPIPTAAPGASPAPTATAVAAATPAPEPRASARAGAWAVEAGLVGYVRFSEKPYDAIAPGVSVTALRPLGVQVGPTSLAVGGAVGWRHHTGGRTFAEWQGRVRSPYITDVDAVPIEGVARLSLPLAGVELFGQAGAGLEYARSSFARESDVPRRTRENDWAPTGSVAVGAGREMLGGRLGARVGVRFSRHAFEAHDLELLHGVETAIVWSRSF